ncbi:hypothetical protein N7489_000607 [Penicillium chrysogenum]|uniref:uncharacterized protein n=1 Tax=Penicillium chrysogenum TaxID=5076 RepID=UPI0024DF0E0B|nr:uncharacterized protein N7489_000607 [Penicillium chrysogenum]KAJ5250197.1 hypothetical protein N7489_000607 [Penicillium chrysogenum]
MKFNLATILAATLTATVAAVPTSEGMKITTRALEWAVDGSHANFIDLWKEDGLNRWRWQYACATCDDFKNSLEVPDGGGNNYHCFDEDDKSFFEVNQVTSDWTWACMGPAAQRQMQSLPGCQGIWVAGAWVEHGFHKDGLSLDRSQTI